MLKYQVYLVKFQSLKDQGNEDQVEKYPKSPLNDDYNRHFKFYTASKQSGSDNR